MKIKEGYILDSFCRRYILKHKDDPTTLITLNETSAFLFEQAVKMENINSEILVSALLEEYEVDEETAQLSVEQVVEMWKEMGIAQ